MTAFQIPPAIRGIPTTWQGAAYARELFSKRQSDRKKAQEVLRNLSDIEVLNKAGITIKGKITRTALLLLGKSEAKYFF